MSAADRAAVCVIGRADFTTGIGTVTAAALELFARFTTVSLLPLRTGRGGLDQIVLPSGRRVPLVDTAEGSAVTFYTDVLWNGVTDFRHQVVPLDGFRVAHMAYDSDELPPEWVDILNERFDLALFSTGYLDEVARRCGVRIPVGTLPIGLDLERLVARRHVGGVGSRVRVGTVSAYHDRKGLDILVSGFLAEFGSDPDVELYVHSNLAMGDTYQRIVALAARAPLENVVISTGDLSDAEKTELLDSFDIYVSASAGEGYSIGPREALALGKPLVLSDIPPHRELGGVPGVAFIPSSGRSPARYPEIDNRVFGTQAVILPSSVGRTLRGAIDSLGENNSREAIVARKLRAADFSLSALEPAYRRVIDPGAPVARSASPRDPLRDTRLPEAGLERARAAAGRHGSSVKRPKVVIPAHDAGFFSLFNVYASHLVWADQEGSPPMVLPDWDAGRLLERAGGRLESYCYSRPEDGNLWTQLFEPVYDLDIADLDDVEFLYDGAEIPVARYNERKEPLLTYVNAYELYRAPWFPRFRSQYSRVIRDRVRLLPEYATQVESFRDRLDGRFLVAAHVKHPSHAVEQPGGMIAGRDRYVDEVRAVLREANRDESSNDWAVFVATDQERVVELFTREFGDHVLRFDDVERVTAEADAKFDVLDAAEQARNGFQLQHLKAADPSTWSVRLAWEVWRDAEAMAASDVLIHAVSNVATALSYLGPDVLMRYCDPE
jgi:glycosyltransferase involved in cell wall biosynthesis